MKRGQTPSTSILQELFNLVIHTFFQILPLIVVVLGLYAIFSGDGSEPQVYDFNRVVAEAEALAQDNFDSIDVPVVASEDFYLYAFPERSEGANDLCHGNACLCMWQEADNIRRCREFKKFDLEANTLPVSNLKKVTLRKSDNVLSVA